MQIPPATLVLLLPAFLSLSTLAFPVVANGTIATRSRTHSKTGNDHMSADLQSAKLSVEGLNVRSPKKHHICHDDGDNVVPCSDPTSTFQEAKASKSRDDDANSENDPIV